jgi:hypothetical protein
MMAGARNLRNCGTIQPTAGVWGRVSRHRNTALWRALGLMGSAVPQLPQPATAARNRQDEPVTEPRRIR